MYALRFKYPITVSGLNTQNAQLQVTDNITISAS